MINKELYEQLHEVVKNQEEPIVLIEQPTPYEGETLRLVYDPNNECFIVGPNAQIDYDKDDKTIYPSYLRNVAEVSRSVFESTDVWINYVTNLWSAHSLNAHFVADLDASYHLFSSIQAIIRSEEDMVVVSTFEDDTEVRYFPKEKVIKFVRLGEEEEVISKENISDDIRDLELMKFAQFWEKCNEELFKQKIAEAQKGLTEEMTEEVAEDLEEEVFDLDNLYDGVEGNSANPIDTSKPETVEDVGCSGGGCTL